MLMAKLSFHVSKVLMVNVVAMEMLRTKIPPSEYLSDISEYYKYFLKCKS